MRSSDKFFNLNSGH